MLTGTRSTLGRARLWNRLTRNPDGRKGMGNYSRRIWGILATGEEAKQGHTSLMPNVLGGNFVLVYDEAEPRHKSERYTLTQDARGFCDWLLTKGK